MSLQWKMHTNFPFSRVFVLGVILFFLGLASIIIAIIAFVTQSWGHFVGTGIWGGSTVLAAGITAVFVSRLRTLASVKTFCVCSMVGMFTSLTVLILSAGGLTLNSGFYGRVDLAEYNKRTSNLIHASLLVISVFCLSGSVLAVIVCCKYIFFEHYDKPKHRRHHRNMSESTVRSNSTLRGGAPITSCQRPSNSRTPLHNEQISRRHSDIVDVNRVQIEYRRSHKRSASDQPHNSHSRRQKHGHLNISHASGSSNSNLLFPNCVRYYPDRRSASNRNSSHGMETRGSRETDRQNIAPPRPGPSRPVSQIHLQPAISRSPQFASPKVRLPTEFNEEELPPYEAVEASANANNSSRSDSGDESDTENSSSTDALSYVAQDEEGIEAIAMVPIESQESHYVENNSRQQKTTNVSYDRSQSKDDLREHQACAMMPCNDRVELVTNVGSCNHGVASVNMRNNHYKSRRPVSGYRNSQSMHQGDSEHLLSVSPEVCAITGESPEPIQENKQRVPHTISENYYENGPCYENVRCGGKHTAETSMNHLSKESPETFTEITNARASRKDKENSSKSSFIAKTVSVQVITHSSPVSNASPQSPLSTFGSPLSAFRPVGAAISALSPQSICSSSAQDPSILHLNSDEHFSPNDTAEMCHRTYNSSLHRCIKAQATNRSSDTVTNLSCTYTEQGAIPKILKHKEEAPLCNSNTSMSWKTILLPLSYNHSESASNESEKKLPSKTIPLADSDPDISSPVQKNEGILQTSSSSKLPVHVYKMNLTSSSSVPSSLSQVSVHKSVALPDTPFEAATEALLAVSTQWSSLRNSQTADNCSQTADTDSKTANNRSQTANTRSQTANTRSEQAQSSAEAGMKVREASTQVNSGSTPYWHSHRMGGNQSLIQSRREELHNCQLSNRTVEVSSRVARANSLLTSGGLSSVNVGVSACAVERQQMNRSSEASSYFANPSGQSQQSPSLALRQNHLLQHYPLQPQQPRLGIQLHHRRQQQNQLQQNIESQQQHQQMQQQQHLVQQPQRDNQQNLQQAQQGRNGRPLFSVLL